MRIQNEAGCYLMAELQGRVQLAADYPGYEHFHPFWELVWANAPICVTVGETQTVTRAALLPAGVSHRVQGAGQPAHMLYLGFRFSGSPRQVQTLLPWPQDAVLDAAAAALLALPQQAFLAAQADVLQLLAALVRHLPAQSPQTGRTDPLVEKVKQLCRPCSSYTVRQMAGMLYVSPSHLGNVFFAATGMHIKQYQTLVRMQEALRLVLTTDTPVADIAAQLGYTSTSYFIRCFEQHHHRTPGAMRASMGKKDH